MSVPDELVIHHIRQIAGPRGRGVTVADQIDELAAYRAALIRNHGPLSPEVMRAAEVARLGLERARKGRAR